MRGVEDMLPPSHCGIRVNFPNSHRFRAPPTSTTVASSTVKMNSEIVQANVTCRSALDRRVPVRLTVQHLAKANRVLSAFKWLRESVGRSGCSLFCSRSPLRIGAARSDNWAVCLSPTAQPERDADRRGAVLPCLSKTLGGGQGILWLAEAGNLSPLRRRRSGRS